jgi:hypothetical protein
VEGSLYRGHARRGKWSVIRGAEAGAQTTVYSLKATETELRLLLLAGDDNVLFF